MSDCVPLTNEQQQAVLSVIPLVKSIAFKISNQLNLNFLSDELESEGYYFTSTLIRKFETERNLRFTTFLVVSLRRYLWNYAVKLKRRTCHITLDLMPLSAIPEDNTHPADNITEKENELAYLTNQVKEKLTEKEYGYFDQLYLRGRTLKEIGRDEGVSAEMIRTRMSKSKKHFRENNPRLCERANTVL